MVYTSIKTTETWASINWRKLERQVYKLQKRIYRAAQRGEAKTVRRLQRLLLSSKAAKRLAVRRISQDNQGKKTAGVDGVKNLNPSARLQMANNLKLTSKAQPTRRVWIHKPGKSEKRPLGIPTIHERAKQALAKLALEPEWEAKFEQNSYGFRPGRSCHDAIEAIFIAINHKSKYVLDADIAKCFDKIKHEKLLNKLNTSSQIRGQIKAWLKSGVMNGGRLFPTDEGTPQGGCISPLLANIALHGLESVIKAKFPRMSHTGKNTWFHRKGTEFKSPDVIRYADDFVILHSDERVIHKCREIVEDWLKEMGLELKPSKTRYSHTLKGIGEEKPGFKFLGFQITQYQVGKYQSKQEFKTIIKPSEESIKKHYEVMSNIIETHKSASQTSLIARLNPVIKGWTAYYSTVISAEIFSVLDSLIYLKLKAWGQRRHHSKSRTWVSNRYWHRHGNANWVFSTNKTEEAMKLLKHSDTSIIRHVKVKQDRSPFDGNLVYWATRKGKSASLPTRTAKLLKRQKGKCVHCGLLFREDDVMEVDHVTPKSKGGRDEYKNLQLLHRHCHDEKTAKDDSHPTQKVCITST
ncbi:group II intron reverse transcriptase/maturase [Mastigocoleus testarum]|uniref:group II intron reverse transcriptase/maturase n=1 Tax=Mastigocoleus testarum TaxID=996925 RepID=UPI0003F7CC4F|nr:group II intron reverse transcriptase/maturase [Mastigocoleus testarum]